MECLTPETSLWIQGPLTERGLRYSRFRNWRARVYEKLLLAVQAMEKDASWKSLFESGSSRE